MRLFSFVTFFVFLIFYSYSEVMAQTRHPSATLDLSTASGGLLLPQMTSAQRDALATDPPIDGMLIYNTTTGRMETYTGTAWTRVVTDTAQLHDNDGDTRMETADDDHIRFYTNGDQEMVLTNTGRLGINTNSPANRVHIEAGGESYAIRLRGSSIRHGIQLISSGDQDDGNTNSGVRMFKDDGSNLGQLTVNNTGGMYVNAENSVNIRVTNNSARVYLNNAGQTGINTTDPTETLSVNGHANKTGGSTWGSFSDFRIKKDIVDYTTGLDAILKIRPVSFQYNDKSPFNNLEEGKPMVGIIAQEMQKILPNTISKTKTGAFEDLLSYNANELTYTLVNAVKEINAKNEALTAENKALKTAVAAIEKRLEKLEK